MIWLLLCAVLASDGGTPPFSERAAQVKVGMAREKVRALLGAPREGGDDTRWSYRDPSDRPDGPYEWWTITFVKGRVSKIDTGSVSCVINE